MGLILGHARGGQQDVAFGLTVGIFHVDLYKEPVQLRLGQRIGAFLFDRVLGGQHMEGHAQRAVFTRHGHRAFLHRLQQRRLSTGTGTVDLIRHQQLTKDRAGDEPEMARTVIGGIQHFGPQNIRRHQVRRELDAIAMQAHHGRQRLDQSRLAQSRQADQQRMPAAQQRRQSQVHDPLLPDKAAGDRGLGLLQLVFQRFDLGHEVGRFGHGFPFRGLL